MPHNRITVICHQCGKPFTIGPARASNPKEGKFCSRACYFASIRTGPSGLAVCHRCGTSFTTSPGQTESRQYCSRACMYAAVRENNEAMAVDRFWSHVQKTESCWEYRPGNTERCDHARVWYRGRNVGAHRFSYELAYGAIPQDMHVLHRCDNPRCVRPDHLFLGTPADNIQDMITKGRGIIGEKNPSARLTPNQVRDIRKLHALGLSRRELAMRYGVSYSTIGMIIRGENWKHLT